MSLTKEKLAQIDDGDFETLVILYLRQKYPSLKGLIQTGINKNDESIKCKVDGILYVHETNECVSVASTVTEIKGLNRKWLGGKKGKNNYEKGDIVKASEEFAEWRKTYPTSKLKLYLATNSYLENNTDLYRDAIIKGKSAGLEVEIIEASVLTQFLDFEAEGQFIRQAILGIEPGRLSESLFRNIASQSLELHRTRFFIGDNNSNEIKRIAEKDILSAIKSEHISLIGIQSASGLGKSTVVRNIGKTINSNGGICLWCPAEEIKVNHNIVSLLQDALSNFKPSFDNQAGDKALEIAKELTTDFVLIVDDINRTSSPSQILDTLRGLSSQAKTVGLNIKFLIPLWNNQFYSQNLSEDKKGDWLIINLQTYSDEEKEQIVDSVNISQSAKFLSLIESLNGDPFLCGLARELTIKDLFSTSNRIPEIIDEIVEQSIQKALRDAAEIDTNITLSELRISLDSLIKFIIQNDNPEPTWSEIKGSIGAENASLLVKLTKTNQLFGFEISKDSEILRWRHDRLRDTIIGKWLADNILSKNIEERFSVEQLFSVPGLAEAWALAIVFTPFEKRKDALTTIAVHQPLALAELLRINVLDKELNKIIVEQLQKHLSGWEMEHNFSLDPKWQILERLRQTDNSDVLEITKDLPKNWWVNLIRFRNGDVESGLHLMDEFHPMSNFTQLEQVIETFKQKNQDNKDKISTELISLSGDKNLIYRILILIGYLGWSELAEVACVIWEKLSEDEKILLLIYFVWALNRCGDATSQKYLNEAILLTRKLSDEDIVEGNIHHGSERYEKFIEPMTFTFRWQVTDESVGTWISIIEKNPDLKEYAHFLSLIDNPKSLENYIRIRAKGDFTPFDIGEFSEDDHGEKSKDNSFQRAELPTTAESRNHLLKIIASEKDNKVRKWAFRFWRRSATSADLNALQSISEEDFLFDEVLRLRVLLRDKTTVDKLVEKINDSPENWCGFCYPLCSEDKVIDALVINIDKAYEDIYHKSKIESLPNFLPTKAVQRLITEKTDWLKSKPRMWPALWGADVPQSLEFVQNCIREAKPDDIKHFFLFDYRYKPLTQRMLDAIAPVLDCFTVDKKSSFALHASTSGFSDWSEKVCPNPSLQGKPVKRWLTKEDGLLVLNELKEKVTNGISEVEKASGFYQLERSHELCFSLRELLKFWVTEKNESSRINIASMLLKTIGEGKDAEWWLNLKPNEDSITFENWNNTLYLLRRRKWQKSN